MSEKRKLLRQVMIILRNIDSDELNLKDVIPIYKDGSVSGYKLEVEGKEKPKLRLVEDEED